MQLASLVKISGAGRGTYLKLGKDNKEDVGPKPFTVTRRLPIQVDPEFVTKPVDEFLDLTRR